LKQSEVRCCQAWQNCIACWITQRNVTQFCGTKEVMDMNGVEAFCLRSNALVDDDG